MRSPFPYKINFAFLVAIVAVFCDVVFHIFLTEPMESFDYFAVKVLIGYFVTSVFLDWPRMASGRILPFFSSFWWTLIPAGIFTFLMSLYYRWWEYLSGVPYSVRPPDIAFINREDTFLFAFTWFIGHSLFYLIGWFVATRVLGKPQRAQ